MKFDVLLRLFLFFFLLVTFSFSHQSTALPTTLQHVRHVSQTLFRQLASQFEKISKNSRLKDLNPTFEGFHENLKNIKKDKFNSFDAQNLFNGFSFTLGRRLDGGDFSVINAILDPVELPLALTIAPKEVLYELPIITILLEANVGSEGICRHIQVSPNGFVNITGEFLSGVEKVDGIPYKVYKITVRAVNVAFDCEVPLLVKVKDIIGLPAGGVNTQNDPGTLRFFTVDGSVQQSLKAYSDNFQIHPPSIALTGDCSANPGDTLEYEGTDLGHVIGIDITGIVVDELRSDPTLVKNDIQTELCKLGNDLADEISNILVQNFLVNESSDFYISDPFNIVPGLGEEVPPALEAEKSLYDDGLDKTHKLFDLSDRNDFFVKLLLPTDTTPEDDPIINTILGFFTGDTYEYNDYDPLLLFLSNALGLNFSENHGHIVDLDLVSILNGEFFSEDPVVNPDPPADLDINVNFTIETLFVNITLRLNQLLLDIDPPPDGPVLPNLIAIGKQTLKVPGLDLNDIYLDGNINIKVQLINSGSDDNIFLKTPFDFTIQEDFNVFLDWDGFVAQIGVLFALDVNDLLELNFGPLLDNIFDCIISTFVLTPRVTGLTVSHEAVHVGIGGFTDAILVLVADVINILIPIYQPIIPRALELLAQDSLANQELIVPTACPLANKSYDDIDLYPYNFSEGLFHDISEIADEDLLNEVLEFAEIEDNGINIIGNTDNSDSNEGNGELSFFATLPPFDGYVQDIDFKLTNVRIEGLLPPTFNELELLKVLENSPYKPQEIHNIIDIGSSSNPLKLKAKLYLRTSEPRAVIATTRPPPIQMYAQENDIDFEISFDHARFLLDVYFKYTQYDVDSQEIGDFIDLYCWVGRLNPFGGVTQIGLGLDTIRVNVNCECNNRFLEDITRLLESPDIWPDIQDFVTDLVDRFAHLIENLFSEEEWHKTVSESIDICANGEITTTNFTDFSEVYHEDIMALVGYLGMFLVAISVPILISVCLRHFGPKLKKKRVVEDSQDGIHLIRSMAFNPLISFYLRIFAPIFFVVNFTLFVIGDTRPAVVISVFGNILDIPIQFDRFQTLSVISSVRELWKAKAFLLAFLLFTFSIAWPYVKLFFLMICWFVPPRYLGIKRRGRMISWLDVLGRISFAEFHFLVFILVVFQLKGGSPNPPFLPEEDIFELRLDIAPQISLFTFALAVVVSILFSNVMLVYSHKIEQENRIKIRKEKLQALEESKKEVGLTNFAIDEDSFEFRMTNWDFTVHETDAARGRTYNYTYSITWLSTVTIALLVLGASGLLFAASISKTLHIEIQGLVKLLVEFADEPSDYQLSVFELLIKVISFYRNSAIIYFVGIVFILTIALIPIFQSFLLFSMLFKSYSVHAGRRVIELHHIVTVWCCVDVFVMAITLTVLELPTVAQGLVSAIEECTVIGEFMQDTLLPLGFIDAETADASCFALHSSISIGGYVAVVAVLFLNIANFLVSKLFHYYIEDRERVIEVTHEMMLDSEGNNINLLKTDYKPYHVFLNRFGFIKFENHATRAWRRMNDATKAQAVAQNPLFDLDSDYVDADTMTSNAKLTQFVPTNKKMQQRREQEEMRLNRIAAKLEYDKLMAPDDRLTRQLRAFFERHDPQKIHLVDKLVEEALSRPDGMYRLNEKLMDKYDATISLDF